ncbi:M28 family metallopeptidase [Nocardioides sp. LHG3406-4]|uniref:M28 family metallopeptidase n=1 Tax=Nocardioides sp. LHG3406-4 TaxID=2804575 RepID=UPI003CF5BAA1
MRTAPTPLLLGLGAVLLVGCSSETDARREPTPDAASSSAVATPTPPPSASESMDPRPVPDRPRPFDVRVARRTVQHLAGEIGPRHATSPAFREAAAWVTGRFEGLGMRVRQQRVETPGGVSWGVPVDAGASANVIASSPDYAPDRPHLVVGAHLDTVPQAPGAEDNASGIGVLLGVAKAIRERPTRLPVVLVAFGAEEPRGAGDAHHHYGSRAYVAAHTGRERRAVRGMVSLDRVGVGAVMPLGSAVEGPDRPADVVAQAAQRAGVPIVRDSNRSSDHWSFVRSGMPGVRLGSTSYAAYHSASDVPGVVDDRQLRRAGRVVLAWLAPDSPR